MDTTTNPIDHVASKLSTRLALRGVAAVTFGILLLAWPGITVGVMALLFGAFAITDGAVALTTAFTSAPEGERGWYAVHGVAGIVTGLIAWIWPGLSALALLYTIGFWATVTGVTELVNAFTNESRDDRVRSALHGLVGVAFGTIMLARPGAGAVALVTLVAAFALVRGVSLIAAGIEVRRGKDIAHDLFARPLHKNVAATS